MQNPNDLDLFLQSPAIQAIPLAEVTMVSEQEIQKQQSRLLGVAFMVEYWICGTFAGWNRSPDVPRDLADYLYGEILCECFSGSKPFHSFLFEETKKVVV